jgi:hypothetical protein
MLNGHFFDVVDVKGFVVVDCPSCAT